MSPIDFDITAEQREALYQRRISEGQSSWRTTTLIIWLTAAACSRRRCSCRQPVVRGFGAGEVADRRWPAGHCHEHTAGPGYFGPVPTVQVVRSVVVSQPLMRGRVSGLGFFGISRNTRSSCAGMAVHRAGGG